MEDLPAVHFGHSRLDAIVVTAGVGGHTLAVRSASLNGLDMWGITVNPKRKTDGDGPRTISPDGAAVTAFVTPTDEELAIARDVVALLNIRQQH